MTARIARSSAALKNGVSGEIVRIPLEKKIYDTELQWRTDIFLILLRLISEKSVYHQSEKRQESGICVRGSRNEKYR